MGGSKKSVTIGWNFYAGLHMLVSLRVDALLKIRINKRLVWSGTAASGTILVNNPNVFGGETREGGVIGYVDILTGEVNQSKNSYLMQVLGADIPAFRRVFSLVWRRPFLQANNPYLFSHEYQVKRTQTTTEGAVQWNLAEAEIGAGEMNPAHIIRECLTSQTWGLGYPISRINDESFLAASATLFSEQLGLTLFWDKRVEINEFINIILNHISGVLYADATTGKFTLKLIRGDYVVATLPVIDPSNCSSLSLQRRGWGETINQVTVRYTDIDTGETRLTAPVQDIGNIYMQSAVIAEERSYLGVVDGDIAIKLANRDLRILSTPLAKVTCKVNRKLYQLMPGDVFKLNWPALNISQLICRVGHVADGSLTDSERTIEAVEDVFGMPSNTFVAPPVSGWVDPRTVPAPCPNEQAIEAGYWETIFSVEKSTIDAYGADHGLVFAYGTPPGGDTYQLNLHTRVGAADWEDVASGTPCAYAELNGAISRESTGTYNIKNGANLSAVVTSGVHAYGYLGNEMVAITAIDTVANTVTLDRGVCDTVPEAHADSTPLFFSGGTEAISLTEYLITEVVDSRLLPTTSLGTLDISLAATMQVTMASRYYLPYPPGNVKVDGSDDPGVTSGDAVFTWAHRSRLLQTAYFNLQTEGNIGPEPGTTYTLRFYDVSSGKVLKRTETGISGTTYTYLQADRITDFGGVGPHSVRMELESIRDGYTSWQYQWREFTASDI